MSFRHVNIAATVQIRMKMIAGSGLNLGRSFRRERGRRLRGVGSLAAAVAWFRDQRRCFAGRDHDIGQCGVVAFTERVGIARWIVGCDGYVDHDSLDLGSPWLIGLWHHARVVDDRNILDRNLFRRLGRELGPECGNLSGRSFRVGDGGAVRDSRAEQGMNALLMVATHGMTVSGNDFSFNSGLGVGLYRSSGNTVVRNRIDFDVRGYSHGFYRRGQDSSGLLLYEQSNDNVFAENSVTHGGDGFFGFAGHEAIGDHWMNRERERLRKETGKQEVDDLIRPPDDLARRPRAARDHERVKSRHFRRLLIGTVVARSGMNVLP